MHVGGVFCDLVKAFDCVNREILLSKLRYYGIEGMMAGWFTFISFHFSFSFISSL
jgi:hypothetical protein